jgi:signal transduction histidine kinase
LEECDRLTHLTDQLLALAREDACAGRAATEPIDLAAVLGVVVETLRPLAEAREVALTAEFDAAPATIAGDPVRLRQVFYNVLDNALKYTAAGGQAAVELSTDARAVVVRVTDTGIGIAPEHLPHVFERFYRVDKARSRSEGGTGLGLSIARGIVAAHGGTIGLTSSPGRGTTVTVTLPRHPGRDVNRN